MTKPLLQLMRFALERLSHPDRTARRQPQHRAPRDAHAQAEQVRAMADAVRTSDPGFARELYAVAYHHEMLASAGHGA